MPAYKAVVRWLTERGPEGLTNIDMAKRGICRASAAVFNARAHGFDIRGVEVNQKRGVWRYTLKGRGLR